MAGANFTTGNLNLSGNVNASAGFGDFSTLNVRGITTGINANYTGSVNLATGGGNVGIGTTAPGAKLDVITGTGGLTPTIWMGDIITDDTAKYGAIGMRQYDTSAESEGTYVVGGYSNSTENAVYIGGGDSGINSATKIRFFTSANSATRTGTDRMAIDSTGNVGIGTTSPDSSLKLSLQELSSSTSAGIAFLDTDGTRYVELGMANGASNNILSDSADTDFAIDANNARLLLGTANTIRMTILNGGNVGIGQTTPLSKLHVTGNVTLEGNFTANPKNLIIDGGFESESTAYWTTQKRAGDGGDGSSISYIRMNSTENTRETDTVANHTTGASYPALMISAYKIPVKPSTTYTLTAWTRSDALSTGANFIVEPYDLAGTELGSGISGMSYSAYGGYYYATYTVTTSWTKNSVTFSTGTDTHYIKVGFQAAATSNSYYVEAAQLTEGKTQFPFAEELLYLKDGNVSIGSTSPSNKLRVSGAQNDYLIRLVDGGASYGSTYFQQYYASGSDRGLKIWSDGQDDYWFFRDDGSLIIPSVSGGNVGIGQTAPSVTLHIKESDSTVPPQFTLENSVGTKGHIWVGASSNNNQKGNLLIQQNASRNIFIDSESQGTTVIGAETVANAANEFEVIGDGYFSGNVGIGITAPASTLSVSGTINSTSNIVAQGGNLYLQNRKAGGINYGNGQIGNPGTSSITGNIFGGGSSGTAVQGTGSFWRNCNGLIDRITFEGYVLVSGDAISDSSLTVTITHESGAEGQWLATGDFAWVASGSNNEAYIQYTNNEGGCYVQMGVVTHYAGTTLTG